MIGLDNNNQVFSHLFDGHLLLDGLYQPFWENHLLKRHVLNDYPSVLKPIIQLIWVRVNCTARCF